jgi:hypothetical protein
VTKGEWEPYWFCEKDGFLDNDLLASWSPSTGIIGRTEPLMHVPEAAIDSLAFHQHPNRPLGRTAPARDSRQCALRLPVASVDRAREMTMRHRGSSLGTPVAVQQCVG